MIDQKFIINTDRLRKSKDLKLKIEISAPSDFLDVTEPELDFGNQINIKGEAYIVDDQLVLQFEVVVPLILVCKVCNGDASIVRKIDNFYHVEDLKMLKSPHFDFGKVLREEILLEIPRYPECNGGSCPEREFINKYIVERNH